MLPLTPLTLCISQIVAHIGLFYWLINIPDIWAICSVLVVYFFTGCLGMSVTYHRLLTHRSFKTYKLIEYIGSLIATLGLTGSSLSWTAAHRLHHSRADRIGDPHSPVILGYIKSQWGSMFSDIDIKKSPVLSSGFHRWLHRNYFHINLSWGMLLYLLGGLDWVLIFWLVPAAILWNAGSLINTVCHSQWLGYRRFDTPDRSVNNPVLGLLMWGEGWHNNHHRHQNSPRIGQTWWEIDIGYWLIRILKKHH